MPYIKKWVQELKKKHLTDCPFEIATDKGIVIQYADLGDTMGFYFQSNRIKFININHTLQEHVQRFVCAHELGHAVMHPKANTPFMKRSTYFSIDKIEREANRFAVELLIPDSELKNYEGWMVNEVAAVYGVPDEVVLLKKIGTFDED